MATVRELVNDAMLEIGVADDVNAVPAEQAAQALRALNRMLGAWSQRRMLQPVLLTVNVPLTGAASYTIGPSGAIVTTRPLRVEFATYVDATGHEWPVELIASEQWAGIYDKALTGIPYRMHYSATNTNGTLYAYPVGNVGTLRLRCRAPIAEYASMNDTVDLPAGYAEALTLGLADALSGSFGKQSTPDIRRRLTAVNRALRVTNYEPVLMVTNLSAGTAFNIERGV